MRTLLAISQAEEALTKARDEDLARQQAYAWGWGGGGMLSGVTCKILGFVCFPTVYLTLARTPPLQQRRIEEAVRAKRQAAQAKRRHSAGLQGILTKEAIGGKPLPLLLLI